MSDERGEGDVIRKDYFFLADHFSTQLHHGLRNAGNGRRQQDTELAEQLNECGSDRCACAKGISDLHPHKERHRSICLATSGSNARDSFGSPCRRDQQVPHVAAAPTFLAPDGQAESRRTIRNPLLPRCSTTASSLSAMIGSTGYRTPASTKMRCAAPTGQCDRFLPTRNQPPGGRDLPSPQTRARYPRC